MLAGSGDARNRAVRGPKDHVRPRTYGTLNQWEARSAALRKQILAAAGLDPLPRRTPLRAQRLESVSRDGYAVERVLFQPLPGYYVGANLYLPRPGVRNAPAVVIPHGHWNHGRAEDIDSYSVPRLAATLARLGFVAFTWDMAGYNDARQIPHVFGRTPEEQLWGFGPLGLQLWTSIRVVDYVESLPEVDASRLAVTGASGGATQTLLLAAVDARLKVSVPVVMVSARFQGDCDCENAPGLRLETDNIDFAALCAPRPQLLVSASGDWTRHAHKEAFPAIRSVYRLYRAEDRIESVRVRARHNYNAESRSVVYRFLLKHLMGIPNPRRIAELTLGPLHAEDLLVFEERPLPEDALELPGLFSLWKRLASEKAEARGPGELRDRLLRTMSVQWPPEVRAQGRGRELFLYRAGSGDRIPVTWLAGDIRRIAVVASNEGAASAQRTPEVQALQHAGWTVLLLDVFQTGRARAPLDTRGPFYLAYNRSADANRVQDILTGLAYAHSYRPSLLRLVGVDGAEMWATFAAAVAPIPLQLEADTSDYRGVDDDLERRFFVPGIQQAGGLGAARTLVPHEPAVTTVQ